MFVAGGGWLGYIYLYWKAQIKAVGRIIPQAGAM